MRLTVITPPDDLSITCWLKADVNHFGQHVESRLVHLTASIAELELAERLGLSVGSHIHIHVEGLGALDGIVDVVRGSHISIALDLNTNLRARVMAFIRETKSLSDDAEAQRLNMLM